MRNAVSEIYEDLVTAVGETLGTHGFTRRGMLFSITIGNNCGFVEFQKGSKSSKHALFFTINLGVICGDLLESGLSRDPETQILDAHVRQRIGMLLPNRPDKWWEIAESTNREALTREVSELVAEKAVPFVKSYLDTKAIVELWESGRSPGLTSVQRTRFLNRMKTKLG